MIRAEGSTMKMLGATKVTTKNKISLLDAVAEELNAKVGDFIVFYKKSNGEIVVKKG